MIVDDLRRLSCPVLVMVGDDDDMVTLEHMVTLFESLPQGQLAVILGRSHFVVGEKRELLRFLILDFLSTGRRPASSRSARRR